MLFDVEIITSEVKQYINLNIKQITSNHPDYICEINRLRRKCYTSSVFDCYIVLCAVEYGYAIITNDHHISSIITRDENIECYDIIWLLDELLKESIITDVKLYSEIIDKILNDVRRGSLRERLLNRKKELLKNQ
jgi:hypothetical protein